MPLHAMRAHTLPVRRQDADIIFMPYNYLLDANTRKTLVDQVRGPRTLHALQDWSGHILLSPTHFALCRELDQARGWVSWQALLGCRREVSPASGQACSEHPPPPLVQPARSSQLTHHSCKRSLQAPAPIARPPARVPQVKWDNAIVIFDEAHNVEGVCSDASSADLTAKQLTDALAEAKRCARRGAGALGRWGACRPMLLQRGGRRLSLRTLQGPRGQYQV